MYAQFISLPTDELFEEGPFQVHGTRYSHLRGMLSKRLNSQKAIMKSFIEVKLPSNFVMSDYRSDRKNSKRSKTV